jgi:hypothetical protein
MGLNEEEMISELPLFVTDPSNKAKVDAVLASRKALHAQENSKKLEE